MYLTPQGSLLGDDEENNADDLLHPTLNADVEAPVAAASSGSSSSSAPPPVPVAPSAPPPVVAAAVAPITGLVAAPPTRPASDESKPEEKKNVADTTVDIEKLREKRANMMDMAFKIAGNDPLIAIWRLVCECAQPCSI